MSDSSTLSQRNLLGIRGLTRTDMDLIHATAREFKDVLNRCLNFDIVIVGIVFVFVFGCLVIVGTFVSVFVFVVTVVVAATAAVTAATAVGAADILGMWTVRDVAEEGVLALAGHDANGGKVKPGCCKTAVRGMVMSCMER